MLCGLWSPVSRRAGRAAAAPDPSVDRSAEKVPGTVCEKTCPGVKLEGGASTPKVCPWAVPSSGQRARRARKLWHPKVRPGQVERGARACGCAARAARRSKKLPFRVKYPLGVHCFDPQSVGHTSPPAQHPSMAHNGSGGSKECRVVPEPMCSLPPSRERGTSTSLARAE